MENYKESIETKIVHGDHYLDPLTGSLAPPLYPSSTFAFKNATQGAELFEKPMSGYFYTRVSNPTIDLLRKKIAILEGTEQGMAFGSGMAAIHAIIVAFAGSGDNLVISDTVYGGTFKLLNEHLKHFGIESRWVDFQNLDDIEKNIDSKTRFLYLESPANPTTTVYDIEKISTIGHKHNLPLVVDNTFMTPYFQKPVDLGADIVVHSATKYLGGHADVVAGLIACNNNYYDQLLPVLIEVGGIISPFDAWLLLRGIKTLHVRMERHSENAMKVARYLSEHKLVKEVFYPGLESHPQYELGKKQMSGFGGMVTFNLKGGLDACKVLMDNVHIFTLAISLGDIDSLIQHPVTMTHSSYDKDKLFKAGITEDMIRLSVGLENADDLIYDLNQALARVESLVSV